MLKRLLSVALAAVLALGVFSVLLARPAKATAVSKMTVSEEMVEMLKGMEGFDAVPFWDYSQWTVGFGSTCPEEDRARYTAEGISPEEAHLLMLDQLAEFEADVNAFMVKNQLQLTQNQFDALVSFVYNVGSAVLRNNESTVIQAILNGAEGNDFLYAIGQWCAAGGDFLYGLLRRRMMEAYMYLYGTYSTTLPNTFCYVKYDPNGGLRDTRAQGYDTNMAAVPLSVPRREGYIFTGWYTAASGGEKVTVLDETTNGMTLYAHWEAGSHTPDVSTDPVTGVLVTVTENDVKVRQSPSAKGSVISQVYRGEKLTITGLTEKDGTLWGYFSRGWVCLEYTDYFEITGTDRPGTGSDIDADIQVPIKATVLSTSGVTVYRGPNSTYPKVGSLAESDTVLILEVMNFCNQLWGRYEGGWICLNQKILLHDDQVLAHSFVATVTYYYLNVRTGPGTQYSSVTQLSTGDQMEIFSVVIVDGDPWGRFTTGWVFLDGYTDFDMDKLAYYQSHSFDPWYTTVETSCSQPGQLRRDCQHCDHYELQEIPMIDHSLGDWYVSKEGTCVEVGQERRDCAHCDYFETKDTVLGDHGFDDWYVSVEANCVTVGQQTRDCRYCDHFETRQTGLGGHGFGQWYETLAPGCETVGQQQRDCEHCEHYETQEIPATGHSYAQWYEILTPECEAEGEQRRDCWNCPHYETEKLPATGHSFGQWYETLAPDCESVGQQQRDCEHCEHYETQEIPATGHSFGQWYETVTPTAETEGEARRDCQACSHYETMILPVNPHVYGDWYVYTEATCVTLGEERRDCSHCEGYESRPIALGDHSYDEWYTCVEATCTTAGEQRRDCRHCDHFETRQTELAEHGFGQWYVSEEATCVTAGQERRDCQTCDHFETRQTALGGHSYGDWYVFRAPGCTTPGVEHRECIHCEHLEIRRLPVAGHSFGQWYVFEEPTCTEEGLQHRDCVNCEHYESRTIAKRDHSYGDWYVVTMPTIDTEGTQRQDCTACGASQDRVMPVLPAVEKVYATITASTLNVRAGTSSGSTKMGTLNAGLVVEILERKTVSGKVWGRMEYGWICLTGYAEVTTVREPAVEDNGEKTYATITCNYVSIRPRPDASTARLATIQNSARVRIYETVTIGSVTWGRTALGWIWLTGYTTLDTEPGAHLEHTFGDWYVSQTGTCAAPAVERRDCTGCDHYETREGQLGDHSFGDWFVSQEATCVAGGEERRNCQHCDHYETRMTEATQIHVFGDWYVATAPDCDDPGQQCRDCLHCDYFESQSIAPLGHSFGTWYVATAPDCDDPGQQCRDCLHCDYFESQPIAALGHSFGDWYVAKEATVIEAGQERRDCGCGHYEVRELPKLPAPAGTFYGTFTGDGYLNIREGAGTGYKSVGKLYANQRVEILEQVDVNGTVWGRIEAGWVCITGFIKLEFEEAETVSVTNLYATITYSYLTIREGCSSNTAKLGTLDQGDVVQILEIVAIGSKNWGRTEEGWICLTGYTTLATTVEEVTDGESIRMYATVTYSYLTIREGCSSNTAKLGTLDQGDVVQILEIVAIGSKNWGRTAEGWICLTGYTTLKTAE